LFCICPKDEEGGVNPTSRSAALQVKGGCGQRHACFDRGMTDPRMPTINVAPLLAGDADGAARSFGVLVTNLASLLVAGSATLWIQRRAVRYAARPT